MLSHEERDQFFRLALQYAHCRVEPGSVHSRARALAKQTAREAVQRQLSSAEIAQAVIFIRRAATALAFRQAREKASGEMAGPDLFRRICDFADEYLVETFAAFSQSERSQETRSN